MSKLYKTLTGGPLHTETAGQIEALIIQYNALIKSTRTKESKELARSNFDYYKLIDEAVYDNLYELSDRIAALARSIGGLIISKRGILTLNAVLQEVRA